MKLSSVAFVLVTTLAVGVPAFAQDAWDDLRHTIREEMAEKKIPGAAVAVVEDGVIVFSEGFGLADVETNRAMTTETRFRVGSIAKMFTAATVLSIANDADPKLSLDAPVRASMPSLPPKLGALTLDELLTHRSGLVDRFTRGPIGDSDLELERGRFSYSNLGYVLAGRVAAAASSRPFESLVEEALFQPLGMNETSYVESGSQTTGYELRKGHARPVAFMIRPDFRPAGFLNSTVGDLARFTIAFMGEGLPKAVVAGMSRPRVDVPADPRDYGYGTMHLDHHGQHLVYHSGDERGGSAFLRMVPEKKAAVIVLTNLAGRLVRTMDVAMKAAAGLPPIEEPKDAGRPLTREEAAELAGTYMNFSGFRIVRSGDSAVLKPWMPWFLRWFPFRRELLAFGQDRFGIVGTTVGPEPLRFSVLRNAAGKIEAIFLMGRAYERRPRPVGGRTVTDRPKTGA